MILNITRGIILTLIINDVQAKWFERPWTVCSLRGAFVLEVLREKSNHESSWSIWTERTEDKNVDMRAFLLAFSVSHIKCQWMSRWGTHLFAKSWPANTRISLLCANSLWSHMDSYSLTADNASQKTNVTVRSRWSCPIRWPESANVFGDRWRRVLCTRFLYGRRLSPKANFPPFVDQSNHLFLSMYLSPQRQVEWQAIWEDSRKGKLIERDQIFIHLMVCKCWHPPLNICSIWNA